ncbi:DNA alkylation repair protein [Candidatus Gracilibacteria bacterium GN02-872]|nr:DNA alkylation repair protein [Candidatus Gracilibacteria bacterium GN02-872]
MKNILQEKLLPLKDDKNALFVAKLIPNIDPKTILGTKIPVLRNLAKEFKNSSEKENFLKIIPHKFFEENLLHVIFLESEKDFDKAVLELEKFLPFVDNWSVCDTSSPKIFKKYPNETLQKIKIWIKSEKVYTIRYAIGLLLSNFLDENFSADLLELVAEVKNDDYYVQMMQAWFFATALAKQYDATISLLESKKLEPFVQNKTIQKSRESRRISSETKKYLLSLKK